ncbi:four helix bundle protein [Chryseobacterium carnipullorum]|uniref:Four helix bundle protein n=2 Tax=Chryseobacterium carnipullorum TaxID=1124835 RepID=A0A1M6ZZS4_CHRCU|nr:four helix bundle protein [Chryseobacterium carnipullorum]AZA67883.1 four helix bundle protein [Chryseobacterium carnipullorum]SHL35910.1 four helix bundle protein [Chryseobacterium carnipullorum]STD12905.1 four helix bundle protein [Chryseobacterium carnipullorum]
MAKNFENFPVYIKSLDLIEKVYQFIRSENLEKEFEFNNQIKRAGFSISNNIAEGSEYNNNRQFIKYLKIAKGSCAEVRSMMIVSKRLKLGDENKAEEIINLSREVSSNISNFIKYLSENMEKPHL